MDKMEPAMYPYYLRMDPVMHASELVFIRFRYGLVIIILFFSKYMPYIIFVGGL